jgi:hypothetical protein
MCATFQGVFRKIAETETRYHHHLLFIVTDGASTDGNPMPFVHEKVKETQATHVCCLLTSDYIPSPRSLLYQEPDGLDSNAQNLFKMSSKVTTDSAAFDFLQRRRWTIPTEGKCRLFLKVNNPEVLNEFAEIASTLLSSNDALLQLIGQVDMRQYVNGVIGGFQARNQGNEGTCYAHAVGTVVHMALSRIVGRKVPPFEMIRDELKRQYGTDGAITRDVLTQRLPGYKLHFNEVDEQGARRAILGQRPCVARFRLDGLEWAQFKEFYRRTPNQILSRTAMNALHVPPEAVGGGHAVVLVRCSPKCLTFLNSWGTAWGDNGFFRVKNAAVLQIQFFDVHWALDDLTQTEKDAWANRSADVVRTWFESTNCIREILQSTVECPLCHRHSKAEEFKGTLYRCTCPKCDREFEPTVERLVKSLHFTSQ